MRIHRAHLSWIPVATSLALVACADLPPPVSSSEGTDSGAVKRVDASDTSTGDGSTASNSPSNGNGNGDSEADGGGANAAGDDGGGASDPQEDSGSGTDGGHKKHDGGGGSGPAVDAGSGSPPAVDAGGSTSSITAPSQAVAAGFSNLVFDDEFDSTANISPTNTGSYKWYRTNFFDGNTALPMSDYTVSDGILEIPSDSSGFGTALSTATTNETTQTFVHAYFEASIKYDPSLATPSTASWPAFWSFALEHGVGDISNTTPYGELDFMEAYPTGTGKVAYITTVHQWEDQNNIAQNSNNQPSMPSSTNYDTFHTYGCLWTPGKVVWYFDNQPVTTVATGAGTPFTGLENSHMYVILGTGVNWPMYVDYVRVWQ